MPSIVIARPVEKIPTRRVIMRIHRHASRMISTVTNDNAMPSSSRAGDRRRDEQCHRGHQYVEARFPHFYHSKKLRIIGLFPRWLHSIKFAYSEFHTFEFRPGLSWINGWASPLKNGAKCQRGTRGFNRLRLQYLSFRFPNHGDKAFAACNGTKKGKEDSLS